MTEESAVKVCVRVRPRIAREEIAASENAEPVQVFWKADKRTSHQIDDGSSTKSFSFDRVFTAEETTNQLYQDIAKPLVVSTVEGYNGTIFAYGQTSSGKTFTMMGSNHVPGVIPLAVEDVFQTIKNFPKKEFLLRVSYMEIYNETVADLLVDTWKRKPLEVRETINKNIFVADLTEELVTSPAQALAWIRKGEKNRHYGKTKMNERSSRSHTIFRMILESRVRSDPASGENADGAIIVSHLNLVDLAGSERASQTGAEGARFKEGCNINRSLFTLGQVIKKLTDETQKGFTNYRDSKLTRILQNSLGGNAKTVIICTITPVTLDETLSTLQFASTAKKMKNDPHVTEVSDDGALLKRYRNEIVDLKRRLQEVSSVTQTTATEKKVLSQLLQEKDQLQREQEDRIKNLTKLLVTGSNLVPVHKMPKRRVTWGGKMLRLVRTADCDDGSSDLSFAESFARKRKADRSCMELGEDDEEFDTHWEIPDEPSEMELSQNSVTVRSFGDSPRDFVSPDRLHELSGKLANLEQQLEMESQLKEEAMAKLETLDGRVAELQVQLQTEVQQKQEVLDKMQTTEQRAADLELQLQLQTEAQHKQDVFDKVQPTEQSASELELQLQTEAKQKKEALEKVEMLDLRVADLERQLEDQSRTQTETLNQMRQEFADTIQLCETLASEKDMAFAERDYLKEELGLFIEQTKSLEKEKAALSQELEEKRETDEFKSLEEEFRKEHENELQNEISSLKKAVESSELQCLQLQSKLETMSEQLKKKSEFAEELQSMSGKDLVQEVAKLRRSLDDAEGISRDTKKEWAVLRSQKIALDEMNVTLAANHERMEAEVNSLRFQLETEKSRYKKMQSDLQKELNVAFDENTKLTTLLDGKVPKNLIDSVELERTVASLNKELTASREAEEALRAQLEELASYQALQEEMASLKKQVCDLTEELSTVQTQRDNLLSAEVQCQEEAQQLRDSLQASQDEIVRVQAELNAAVLGEKELNRQFADVTQQLDSLRSDLERSNAERNQLMASVEDKDLKLEEIEQHRASLEGKVNEMQQLMKDLEEKLTHSEVSRSTEEEISKELQEQVNQLNEELQGVRAEKDALLSEQKAGGESSAEEVEKLLSTVASLTAERDQLKLDMQENVEMMIENQEELRTALEKNREQRHQIKQLEAAQSSGPDGHHSDMSGQLEELQTHMKTLTEELESLRAERDSLLSERTGETQSSTEDMDNLLTRVTSLTEERDQLQEILEGLREEKKQLRAELEDRMETLQTETRTLTEKLQLTEAERDNLLTERTSNTQSSTEDMDTLLSRVTSLTEERDQLQEILEGLREEKKQLRAELEERMEMVVQTHNGFNQPEKVISELHGPDEQVTQLQQEMEQLQAALQNVTEQKSQVEGELQRSMEMAAETQSLLHVLQEQLNEQNQRNANMERISQEKQAQLEQQVAETNLLLQSLQEELQEQKQNKSELENLSEQKQSDLEKQIMTLNEELAEARAERDAVLEKEASCHTSSEEMDTLLSRVTSLTEERDQLQETLQGLREEKKQLRAELEERMEMMQCDLQQQLNSEPQSLKEEQETQQLVQIQQLEEHLEKTKEEVTQLKSDLKENVELMIENQEELRESQEKIRALQEEIKMLKNQKAELENTPSSGSDAGDTIQLQELQDQIQRLTKELESLRAERDSLLSERTGETQSSTEDMDKLLTRVTSLTEERDQLQEILEGLREEKKQLRAELEDRMETLQTETRTLTEKLQLTEAERDNLLTERTSNTQSPTEDMDTLLSRVTSLTEERDQLQEILEGLREEKKQLRAELEERMETLQTETAELNMTLQTVTEQKRQLEDDLQLNLNMVSSTQELLKSVQEELHEQKNRNSDLEKQSQEKEGSSDQQIRDLAEKLEIVEAERNRLLSEKTSCQSSTEDMEKLLCRVTSVTEERDQLQEIVEGMSLEKKQLRAELEDRVAVLQAEMGTLTHKLQMMEAERDALLSEKNSSAEEMEKLLCRVTSLTEERDQLQELLAGLSEEKTQLRAGLEERMEMVSAIQEKLSKQEQLIEQLQSDRGEQEGKLQQDMQQLEEQLQMLRGREAQAKVEADVSQQLLSEANVTISALREQLSSLEKVSGAKEVESSRLQESTGQLQESFGRFQHFIDTCSKYNSTALNNVLRVQCSLKHTILASLPKPTMEAYNAVCQLGLQTVQTLIKIKEQIHVRALGYKKMFEKLVKKDLAVFEERRLQDVLLSREQAPSYSVKDDFHTVWERRLTELLDKRQFYLQKMPVILEKLWANFTSYLSELKAEIQERETFREQLQSLIANQSISFSDLDKLLSQELKRRSAVGQSKMMPLQDVIDEQSCLFEEVKQLEAQTESQLREEKSKSFTLLQALEGAPLKSELSLLKDNQQLVIQLQEAEEKVKVLHAQNEQLEEAHITANNSLSNHKRATQLLQTELQDSRAVVEEKEDTIQTLKCKLRESEKKAPPSAVELEKLQNKLFQMEVKLSSASDEHKKEIDRMTTLLSEKEDSLRKLKEILRKSQQGEESFLQGEDLHARLTHPRGLMTKSSVMVEKTKLEEEIKQLQLKITELESVVSSQQVEISKWKNRALKLKVKSKTELEKPSSQCTPTKRPLLMTSDASDLLNSPKKFLVASKKALDSPGNIMDSPRKLLASPKKGLDSPKVSLLDSPKSRIFDMGGSSELLSRTCPKQFFDNSSLGTVPEVSDVPDTPEAEKDAAVGADRKEWWSPKSPKQDEMCKTQ
ncbi:LOW QUALITY PROTEIN: centromere-associated protein E-like [Mugil cephalus]|uniref:LOW QUALITY PROTEIN: centromere-associated protein E-like n=1 Tax=Mugil cephalus TaxID=48193 RepID=UPI001FB598ED|nr:LOW QUALITY PROTEIN: centromere-associated protein E-like [Mugil cephalus]